MKVLASPFMAISAILIMGRTSLAAAVQKRSGPCGMKCTADGFCWVADLNNNPCTAVVTATKTVTSTVVSVTETTSTSIEATTPAPRPFAPLCGKDCSEENSLYRIHPSGDTSLCLSAALAAEDKLDDPPQKPLAVVSCNAKMGVGYSIYRDWGLQATERTLGRTPRGVTTIKLANTDWCLDAHDPIETEPWLYKCTGGDNPVKAQKWYFEGNRHLRLDQRVNNEKVCLSSTKDTGTKLLQLCECDSDDSNSLQEISLVKED